MHRSRRRCTKKDVLRWVFIMNNATNNVAGNAIGKLTTHVLDNSRGAPGAGIVIQLFEVVDNHRQLVLSTKTNADGRCDAPLLSGDAFKVGVYELDFHAGAYFLAQGVVLPQPPFIDVVTLRFGIADATAHYHVPLLVTPWAYSTYRGS
jgi:5-hydroxyisourate hydrolase